MDADAVVEANIDARRRLVDVPTTECDEPHGEFAEGSGGEPKGCSAFGAPAAVDPDLRWAVDEDVGHVGILEEWRKGTELGKAPALADGGRVDRAHDPASGNLRRGHERRDRIDRHVVTLRRRRVTTAGGDRGPGETDGSRAVEDRIACQAAVNREGRRLLGGTGAAAATG